MINHIEPSDAQRAAFSALTRQGPIHMLNLVRLREHAQYPDGRTCSGEDAYRAYMHESASSFERVGGRVQWMGTFECLLIGPHDEHWDYVFIAVYPSSQAFERMLSDPAYVAAVKHRQAAVEDSRLIRLAARAR